MRANETVGFAAPYAAEVCDRHRHCGACNAMCASALEVHAQVSYGHVINEGVRKAHLEPLGGPFAVFGAAHADLAQIRAVEARIQHVEAATVSVRGVVELIIMAHGSSV